MEINDKWVTKNVKEVFAKAAYFDEALAILNTAFEQYGISLGTWNNGDMGYQMIDEYSETEFNKPNGLFVDALRDCLALYEKRIAKSIQE